jgi:hypothetical protein
MEMTPEGRILHDIRLALGREPDLVLWRLGAGVTVDKKTGKHYRAGLVPGAADLIGILAPSGRRWGLFFALEVKTARSRLSPQQKLWGELVTRMGGFYRVVRSVDEARAALDDARRLVGRG